MMSLSAVVLRERSFADRLLRADPGRQSRLRVGLGRVLPARYSAVGLLLPSGPAFQGWLNG